MSPPILPPPHRCSNGRQEPRVEQWMLDRDPMNSTERFDVVAADPHVRTTEVMVGPGPRCQRFTRLKASELRRAPAPSGPGGSTWPHPPRRRSRAPTWRAAPAERAPLPARATRRRDGSRRSLTTLRRPSPNHETRRNPKTSSPPSPARSTLPAIDRYTSPRCWIEGGQISPTSRRLFVATGPSRSDARSSNVCTCHSRIPGRERPIPASPALRCSPRRIGRSRALGQVTHARVGPAPPSPRRARSRTLLRTRRRPAHRQTLGDDPMELRSQRLRRSSNGSGPRPIGTQREPQGSSLGPFDERSCVAGEPETTRARSWS